MKADLVDLKPMKRRLRPGRLMLFSGLVLAALVVAAMVFARNLLCVESIPWHAEVIIVLGGEPEGRAGEAGNLFNHGVAPAIIVSGDGDTDLIRRNLMQAGVPAGAIELESRSSNTKENAEFTAQLLKRRGVRRAIIVTSWFHSRRALNSFRSFAPEIQFASVTARHDEPFAVETTHVFREYLKTGWYLFHYHISPW
jgi:uncharacterized SAM-binding protein YcdF (DUF218 family)